MDPLELLRRYYDPRSQSYKILLDHSRLVARKALEIARLKTEKNPDLKFIREAALLHDIGIFRTDAPDIGCTGDEPYIRHGLLGSEILEGENLPRHAKVSLTHTNLCREDIIKAELPLPHKDFLPQTVEEEIISLADRFYSKNPQDVYREYTIEEIRNRMRNFKNDKAEVFENLCRKYKLVG